MRTKEQQARVDSMVLNHTSRGLAAHLVDLEDEITRLREGLTYIATQTASDKRNPITNKFENNHGHRWQHWKDIAQRLLDGKPVVE